jgi:hypothetical protein
MGREVRRVPANWRHPKDEGGDFIPLFGQCYTEAAAAWDEGREKWAEGLITDYEGGWESADGRNLRMTWEEWAGERPEPQDYFPDWPEDSRTHFQMYETTTEGTPISPVMASPESLARWLADTGASAFAGMTAPYESWLRVCRGGYAPSGVVIDGEMTSGVEAMGGVERERDEWPDMIDEKG